MKTIRLIIAVAGLMLLTTSCEWYCHNRNEGNIEMLPAHKSSVPYKDGDTCSFIDKAGNIVRFVVTKRNNWSQKREQEGGGFVECSDYFLFEEDVITLTPVLSHPELSEINLRVSIMRYYGDGWRLRWDNNVCRIEIFLGSIGYYPCSDKIRCSQDGVFLTDEGVVLHETMKINNKIYEQVIEHNGVFYNQAYGILKVTQSKKDILTINR